MGTTSEQHQRLQRLLADKRWDQAENLWLELAETMPGQTEFLLLLTQDFAAAGRPDLCAALAALIAPSLKDAGKLHEWLYALKLQATAAPDDKALRAELLDAYRRIYGDDPRLKTILAVAGLEAPGAPLPAAIARADTLLTLDVGAFCFHKSWGYGRVRAFDANLQRIIVSFPHNPEHAMQLAYAAESLARVSPEHIEVRKLTAPEELRRLAAEDPLALLRIVLLSFNRAATPAQIESVLAGPVVATGQWKKWWETARKLLKRDPHFVLPSKKSEPVVLRTAPVSQQDELLEAFRDAPGLEQKLDVARQLLKIADEIEDPELLLQEFQDGLLAAMNQLPAQRRVERLETACLLEQLRARQRAPAETHTRMLQQLLEKLPDPGSALEQLSAPAMKRALAVLKQSNPERLVRELNALPARALAELGELLEGQARRIEQLIRNQTASADLLIWLCDALTAKRPPAWMESLPRSAILLAALNAVDLAGKPAKRLRDMLLEEESLLTDLLVDADAETIRNLVRQIIGSPAFEELDRRSLMARLVKEFPFVQDLLVSRPTREQPLVVSHASYERRRKELDEIIQKKIPQNSRDIAQARSYGDLRENFEYKAAKDMQRLLMRRRAELEVLLGRAQPTDFSDARADAAGIGATVTVTDLATGRQQVHHILGAWDGDPERGILSYPAALSQSMLNKRVGDVVEFESESGRQRFRIDRIEKTPAEIIASL
jgi:transcription elongation factor GreA-like protein/transcription elongation GreA/GreB family factor